MNSYQRHVIRMLTRIERNQEIILAEIDTLTAAVQQAISIEAGAVTMIKGMVTKIEQLAATPSTGNAEADLAAFKAEALDLSNQLNTQTSELVTAMTNVPDADVATQDNTGTAGTGGTVENTGTVSG